MAYLQNPDLHAESGKRTGLYPTWEQCFEDYPKDLELCPACDMPLDSKIPWFRLKKSGFSLWCCEEHHMVLGRMRMKKTPDGKVYGSIAVRLTDPGSARLVSDRYDEYLIYGSQGKPIVLISNDPADPEFTASDIEVHPPLDRHPERAAAE